MKKIIVIIAVTLLLTALLTGCGGEKKAPEGPTAESAATGKVNIGIGYQSPTAQTWGAVIMKNQKMFEQELSEKFPRQEFNIEWFNSPSGPPLTNNMISSKLQLAFMGDMPILINGPVVLEARQKAMHLKRRAKIGATALIVLVVILLVLAFAYRFVKIG